MVSSTKWKLPFCFASHTIKRPPKELSVLPFGDLQPHGEFTPCQKQGLFHWFRAELVFQKCLGSHILTCLLPLCHKKLLESLQWSPSCFPENNFFQNSTDIFVLCLPESKCPMVPLHHAFSSLRRNSHPKMVTCDPWSDIDSLRFSSCLKTAERKVSYSSRCILWP